VTSGEDLLEVIVIGLVAGVGLSASFALAIRGIVEAGDARREGRGTSFVRHAAIAAVFLTVCVGAVAFAIYSMLHH
jgi:hypothetical protein